MADRRFTVYSLLYYLPLLVNKDSHLNNSDYRNKTSNNMYRPGLKYKPGV